MDKSTTQPFGHVNEARIRKLASFTEAWHGDEAFRSRAETDPRGVLADHGIDMPPGPDLRIVADTAERTFGAI